MSALHFFASVALLASLVPAAAQFRESSSEQDLVEYVTRHPYIVNIRAFGRFACTGVLVGPYTVLTAAQCVDPVATEPGSLTLWLNATRTEQLTEDVVVRRSVQTVLHPAYTGNAEDGYNIALLKMNASAAPLRQIRILPEGQDHAVRPEEDYFLVLGFGRTTISGKRTNALQIGQVQVLGQDQCEAANFGYLPGQMFCVDANLPCSGDQGGPVFRDGVNPQSDVLFGLISGTRCLEVLDLSGVTNLATADVIEWMRNVREEFEEDAMEELLRIEAEAPGSETAVPEAEPDIEDLDDDLIESLLDL